MVIWGDPSVIHGVNGVSDKTHKEKQAHWLLWFIKQKQHPDFQRNYFGFVVHCVWCTVCSLIHIFLPLTRFTVCSRSNDMVGAAKCWGTQWKVNGCLLCFFLDRSDSPAELAAVCEEAKKAGAFDAVVCNNWAIGGAGAVDLAQAVDRASQEKSNFKFLYDLDVSQPPGPCVEKCTDWEHPCLLFLAQLCHWLSLCY